MLFRLPSLPGEMHLNVNHADRPQQHHHRINKALNGEEYLCSVLARLSSGGSVVLLPCSSSRSWRSSSPPPSITNRWITSRNPKKNANQWSNERTWESIPFLTSSIGFRRARWINRTRGALLDGWMDGQNKSFSRIGDELGLNLIECEAHHSWLVHHYYHVIQIRWNWFPSLDRIIITSLFITIGDRWSERGPRRVLFIIY